MAITYENVTSLDPAGAAWLVEGKSDQATPVPIRFYLDGVPAGELQAPAGKFQIVIGPYQDLEVLDRACQVARPAFPARWTLYWPAVSGTVYYRIDELVGATWTERARITDLGQGHFVWRTGVLLDTVAYQFRVVPVFAGGLEAAAISFSATMVRRPDPPRVTFSYSSASGKVTIS